MSKEKKQILTRLDSDAIDILKAEKEKLNYTRSYSQVIRDMKGDIERADKHYNGWTNYETWAVNLWLGNDSGSDAYWREAAQEALTNAKDDKTFTKTERATLDLMQRLKDEIEEGSPLEDKADMYNDLMGAALSEINYHEIAQHMINDIEG